MVTSRTATSVAQTTASSSVTLTKPTGTTVGDVLVAGFATNGALVSSAPSGWTLLGFADVSNPRVYAYYRLVSAADTSVTSWTWTVSSSVTWGGGMQAFVGVSDTTVLDVAAVTAVDTSSTAATISATIAPVTAGAMVVGFVGANSGSISWTPPTGFTEDFDVASGKNSEMAHFTQAAAGSATYTWTISSGRAQGLVLAAFRPGGQSKAVAGSVTASASVARVPVKVAAASVTAAGSYKRSGFTRILAGQVTPAGVKIGRLSRSLFGAVFPAGVLQRGYPRTVTGSISAAGSVLKQSAGRFFFGSVTGSGTAARASTKRHAGGVTGVGIPTKTAKLTKTGTVTGSGTPNQLGVRFRAFVGSLTAAGTVRRITGKKPAGVVTPARVPRSRTFTKRPKGVITASATTLAGLFRRVFGRAGTTAVSIGTAAELDIVFYARQRVQIMVRLETAGGKPLVRDADAYLSSGSLFRATAAETPARSNLTSGSGFTGTLSTTSGSGFTAGFTGGF